MSSQISAELHCAYVSEFHTDWTVPVSGSPVAQPAVLKGGIITPCPRAGSVFGLARITWSSLCNSLSSIEVFWGRINNSRLPWRSHVSANESSHQKIEGQPTELVILHQSPLCRSAADRFFTNSSPIRTIVMRTSCISAEEP